MLNTAVMAVTLEVSQSERLPLNLWAPLNMWLMVVTPERSGTSSAP